MRPPPAAAVIEAAPTERSRADYSHLRKLMAAGYIREVLQEAAQIIASADDSFRVAQARLFELGGKINARDRIGVPIAIGRAHAALQRSPHPRLTGEFHALAAYFTHTVGSLERCGRHLVSSERALTQMTERGIAAVDAWHDLAETYSVMGFHEQARSALSRGLKTQRDSGLAPSDCGGVEVGVRHALWLDHSGDTHGCVRTLQETVRTWVGELGTLSLPDQNWIEYAVRRLVALGWPAPVEIRAARPSCADSAELSDLSRLAEACILIAEREGKRAIALLDDADIGPETAGPAEIHRLRSLAHAAAGDLAAALTAERTAARTAIEVAERVRPLFLDSASALLDQDHLRQSIARYADAALTDPLTGLPNRRRVDLFIAEVSERSSTAMLGFLDMDDFKMVNDTHGHLAGDLVLQRVAGVLARSLRRGDLLARCGGDEFLVVLPNADLTAAHDVGERITEALATEDWEALLPGTSISVSIGWAPLNGAQGMQAAFAEADRAMFASKRERQGPVFARPATD